MGLGIYTIAVTLIAIMLSIAGMVLGLGYALNDKKLKEFGISEIYQCAINGIIVSALIIAFSQGGVVTLLINNIVGSASLGAACGQSMSSNYAICFSYNYLVGLSPVTINGASYPSLIDTSLGVLVPVSVLYTGLSILGSVKLSLGIISIGFSSAFTPVLTALDYTIRALTASIIAIEVQGILLKFVSAVAIPVLLPIGIVLRTFYATRKLGGAIIAIAIGLFTVLPLSYVLNAEMVSTYAGTIDNSTVNSYVFNYTSSASGMLGSLAQAGAPGTNRSSNSSTIGYLEGSVTGFVRGFESLVNGLEGFVALLIVEVFFLPVFSLVLTVISIRELARILGSEVSFGRLYMF